MQKKERTDKTVTDILVCFGDYQQIKESSMQKNGENFIIEVTGKSYYCPVELSMDVIGGKWKAVILWYLIDNTLRFHELKKEISSISERVLTRELRQLENYRLIKRKVYPEVPPRVEYCLTDFGKNLIPLLNQISKFGETYAKNYGEIRKDS